MKLTGKQITSLAEGDENVKGFEGWTIEYDTETGSFDAEKGAMYDFDIELFDPKGNHVGTANGGYYTAISGFMEDQTLEFVAPVVLSKEEIQLNNFLEDLVDSNYSYEHKIKKMKKFLEKVK